MSGSLKPELWIRIHWIRIRTQHFKWFRVGSRVLLTKNWKFFNQKWQFTYVQATGEVFSSKKKNIQHFKKWNLLTFFYVCWSFLPSWIRLRIANPDPATDPGTLMHPDPIRIRIHRTVWSTATWNYPATSCSSDWRVLLSERPSARGKVGRWWQDPQKRVDSQSHRCVSHHPENTSVLRIRDFYPWSRIRLYSIPDPNFFHPGSRIHMKELKYFNPKNCFLSSRKYDLGCSSQIRILIFYPSRIPRSKRHRIPDPGSGSATLKNTKWFIRI